VVTRHEDDDTSGSPALGPAQRYIAAVEGRDLEPVAATLSEDVVQLFLHSRKTTSDAGAAQIIAGHHGRAFNIAEFRGRTEVLAYTKVLIAKFDPLQWRDHQWRVAPGGRRAFFRGKGDMLTTRSKRPYRNDYVTRFDIEDGQIVQIVEYADGMRYLALRIGPSRAEARALLRALGNLRPKI
jgi:ketosteroid isomerase-like protein